MKNLNTSTLLAAGTCAMIAASAANAAVVVGWSIPAALTGTLTGANYAVGEANDGANKVGSNLTGVHASASTVWSSPTGNGSTNSFSSNNWAIGDYYQVSFATTGYQDLSVSWDQARSGTGPATFKFQVSINNGSFTDVVASYTVGVSTSTTAWNSTTYQSSFTTTQALAAGANDAANVRIRFTATVAPTGGSPTGGTGRVDNIVVSGTAIPAPGAIALIGLAGLVARRRRN
jgi:MYXO-CTERM domain-containing protein